MRLCYLCICVHFLMPNANSCLQDACLPLASWGKGWRRKGACSPGLGLAVWPGALLVSLTQAPSGVGLCQDSHFRELCYSFYMEGKHFFFAFCYHFGIMGFTLHPSLLLSTIPSPQAGSDPKIPSLIRKWFSELENVLTVRQLKRLI